MPGTQGTPQLFSHWEFCAGNGTPEGQRCNHTPHETPELFSLLTSSQAFFFFCMCVLFTLLNKVFHKSISQSIFTKAGVTHCLELGFSSKRWKWISFSAYHKQEDSSSIKSTFPVIKFEDKGGSEHPPFFASHELKLCFPSELP